MEIGIIGFGRFGRFAGKVLKQDFEIFIYDQKQIPNQPGARVASLEEIARKPILLLCIPISQIESVCHQLRPLLKTGQLILDTCSVKERPLEMMTKILPKSVEVLGTHPLFGPDSAKAGIRGLKVALCQGRCRRTEKVQKYLEHLGLEVIRTTAARHDREMAKSQALFHFLARGIADIPFKLSNLSTPGPTRIFREFEDVQKDSLQLFHDIHRMNRFAPAVRKKLVEKLIKIDGDLSE
jgi:prephenate dehydrogenase